MNEAQITLEKPTAQTHVPQSLEVMEEHARRHQHAQRYEEHRFNAERDRYQKEQDAAEVIRKRILHDLD